MSYFGKYFKKHKGITPKNEEEEFQYAVIDALYYINKDIQKIKKNQGIR